MCYPFFSLIIYLYSKKIYPFLIGSKSLTSSLKPASVDHIWKTLLMTTDKMTSILQDKAQKKGTANEKLWDKNSASYFGLVRVRILRLLTTVNCCFFLSRLPPTAAAFVFPQLTQSYPSLIQPA